jgi:hypothetical protein
VPRSRVCRKTGPRGRQALEAWRCPSGPGLACRPNLAGWLSRACFSHYFENEAGVAANYPSMLLSFERPALAGIAWIRPYVA